MDLRIVRAVKVFIIFNGKVLILRESGKYLDGTNIGKYDVPGGRFENDETLDGAWDREMVQEIGYIPIRGELFYTGDGWKPIINGERVHVKPEFYKSFTDTDKVVLSDDHDQYLWINPLEYKKYSLIENLHPVFEAFNGLENNVSQD